MTEYNNFKDKLRSNKKLKCPDTPSECNLVIDDASDENQKKNSRRSKPTKPANESSEIVCNWANCGKTIYDYYNFIYHVEEHAVNSEFIEDQLQCKFDCTFETSSHPLLIRHAAFHAYHERLKNMGEKMAEWQELPKCTSLDKYELVDNFDYKCRWIKCRQVSNTTHELFEHIKVHVNKFPKFCVKGQFNKCQWLGCQSKFTSIYKLGNHMRSHTGERVIACPTCGNMFASNTRYADHRKRQIPTEMQSYQCSECSKLFSTERLLRDHMRSHINHYKCTMCDMTCSRPSELSRHIRFRHMTERPFKCSLCPHACVTKANLENHLTTHCAENLVACEYCEFRCRSVYGLERHHLKEHGDGETETGNLYECHCCQKRFVRGGHLTKHLMKKHDFNWPSGHSRFKYKQENDGFYRLQTVRYESLEVTQEMTMAHKPTFMDGDQYEMTVSHLGDGRIAAYVVRIQQAAQPQREVILNIDDVDEQGNVVKREIVADLRD